MDRRPLVDPEEGRTEALVVGSMALAGALLLLLVVRYAQHPTSGCYTF